MKTLHQSLIDYDMALLEAIAECRGVTLTTSSKNEAIQTLTQALLSPTETAIILDSLLASERGALRFLLDNGGQIEGPRFMRHYGVIRPMGAARLEREKPWQQPANPAERLWYTGFIFKAFQLTTQGNLEIIFIPTDVLPLLETAFPVQPGAAISLEEQTVSTPTSSDGQLQKRLAPPALVPQPQYIVSGEGRLREGMFSLLAYLQTNSLRLQSNNQLSAKDKKSIAETLPPALLPGFDPIAELEFLVHLGQRAELLTAKYGRLKPERETTRRWLHLTAAEQLQLLRKTWRADPTWNDLWHTPGLAPRPTGWENSPLLARSKILGHLADIATGNMVGEWLSVDDFVAKFKQVDPDFQRPDGDYESWYIYDADGRPLMGFEHWDAVEGALIRYILTNVLLLLGVTDVGLNSQTSPPTGFKITPQGAAFLQDQLLTPTTERTLFLRVKPNFQVDVPHRASLYDRFQLNRFAELEQREENRVVYKITQGSIGRALRNGVTADQVVAFLARASNNQTPLKVVETLRTWGRRQDTVRLERATILRVKDESLVEELRQQPLIRPLLGEIIGPTTLLIPAENVREVRRLLMELGYLIETEA